MPNHLASAQVPPSRARFRSSWVAVVVVASLLLGACAWLVISGAPVYRFLIRLYLDKTFMAATLRQWGVLAPLGFIVIQALQVVIAPIPGEVTGLLGGFIFGQWLGFFYSTLGLTAGSLFAFWVGRRLGAPYVRRLVSSQVWERIGFTVQAEGALLCFVIYVFPGLLNDFVCSLFGISAMPCWIFADVS